MRSSLAAALDEYPIYPLPGAVLFPGMVLPLQLHAAQHRRMVVDALGGHGHWLVSMIRAGAQADNSPPVHAVGCLGRLVHCQTQADGALEVWVEGMRRARMTCELQSADGMRSARAQIFAAAPTTLSPAQQVRWRQLHRQVMFYARRVRRQDVQLAGILCEPRAPLELVDLLSTLLVPDPLVQQALLQQLDLDARLAQMIECVAAAQTRLSGSSGLQPQPS